MIEHNKIKKQKKLKYRPWRLVHDSVRVVEIVEGSDPTETCCKDTYEAEEFNTHAQSMQRVESLGLVHDE